MNKRLLTFLIIGLILIVSGLILSKFQYFGEAKVEVISDTQESAPSGFLTVEVAGSVIKPGVYKLSLNDRIENALIASGGLSVEADREWVEKNINRASKLSDGQKIYIPHSGEVTANTQGGGQIYQNTSMVLGSDVTNINSASQASLEELWGIGPSLAKKIIEQRPYSSIEELVSKKIIKQSVFETIKGQIVAQ